MTDEENRCSVGASRLSAGLDARHEIGKWLNELIEKAERGAYAWHKGESGMANFTWNFCGIIAHNPRRETVEEFNGWWKHIAFGICIFIKKKQNGWSDS